MIRLTEAAINQVRFLAQQEGIGNPIRLRIRVKKGGCSGLSYEMSFEASPSDEDQVMTVTSDIQVVIDRESWLYVLGLSLDYEGGLNGKGFIYHNPNAVRQCGCGQSFGVN